MLRKVIDAEGRDWDQLIPHILFVYREVPQVSTGLNPTHLRTDYRKYTFIIVTYQ